MVWTKLTVVSNIYIGCPKSLLQLNISQESNTIISMAIHYDEWKLFKDKFKTFVCHLEFNFNFFLKQESCAIVYCKLQFNNKFNYERWLFYIGNISLIK